MHRWELEARELIKSLQFKAMTERELQLWNHLRMCLDDLENYSIMESNHINEANNDKPGFLGYMYGDGL
jgi:hypothetical protein